jgi:hypothetical protein
MSKISEVYLIDYCNSQILLMKNFDATNNGKKFIKGVQKDPNLHINDLNKFITIDIEAICDMDLLQKYGDNTKFEPIMISGLDFYTGQEFQEELHPYQNTNELNVSYFFNQFFTKRFHKYVIYAHNLSAFDGIFILRGLVILSERHDYKIEPLIRDGKIISVKCRFHRIPDTNKFRYYFELHDSLLLLLNSLEKLGKSFLSDRVDLQKSDNTELLPWLLSEYYRHARDGDETYDRTKTYLELKSYCKQDCLALAHIIYKFAKLIYDKWGINIHKHPTISSLALQIYLMHYLENDSTIPLISGGIYNDIKKSYHGGHTDVYELYSKDEVHSYDFTSMYPYQMFTKPMPTGKITKFEGNPIKFDESLQSLSDKLAFIKCDVYVDKSLDRPPYQTHIKIDGETISMCATGLFKNQWVYVPELLYYEQITNGLTRIIPETIKQGYLFESNIIFKDYINDLFKIKQSVNKSNPLYLISKILMNSLYGRMGLKQELTNYLIMDNLELEKFTMSNDGIFGASSIKDIIEFDDLHKSLVITSNNSEFVELKSSVAIASAITAYARMEMATILLDKELDILYTDTDSFKCKQKITELAKYKHLNHKGLGGLLYEGTFKESLFLLPKVYGGIYKEDNSEIVKIKGFKDKIEFNQLKELLLKNHELNLVQNKWYRDLIKSEIKIMKTPYKLTLNNNKRIIDLKTLKTYPYHFKEYDPDLEK